jgi:nucleotide-binding universal stress UspA family protein
MFKHILIPTDGSPLSNSAIEYGILLAKSIQAKITVMTVSPPSSGEGAVSTGPEGSPAETLRAARGAASKAGVACATLYVEHDHPHQAIIDTAAKRHCDLIAMTSHGRGGLSAVALGSETNKVLANSAIPVLVFRQPPSSLLFKAWFAAS